MSQDGKVIVVMPAYNAESTLEKTLRDIPQGSVDEVILVDDASSDGTVELAGKLGVHVIEHQENRGYGANQKTCYREALNRGADFIVMIHPDYQYDSSLLPVIVGLLRSGNCDVLLGNRIRSRREALSGGMPAYKYFANRLLTIIENLWAGENLGEWHSGLRAYTREVLETLPWEKNSDDFVFDSQFLVQSVHFGFRVGDIPVPVRYMKEASSIGFARSMEYGMLTLETFVRWTLHRWNFLKSELFEEKSEEGSPVD
ncbi:MAG: glycosyltransferase family 2 protein [Candidatus Krumholzibacteria bacterium]|jgi:glycosyltransferase involved in cell wall biosynthesis|nr:glycosyltransferase family 2 protein [Candidatus Krumholzibacteria bacterium]MDP6669412.1 glycosyltransferase family 2 protein [Candidatus Krumholzibacteria bacterium]MDP6798016.1 glycosyltransferase family 2 protein [Candidatus Krumholzibacteria bacterium]MDP7021537.1 glycosyltransferase family 2 protein [Candidatus Krumholzibacteria bacterium]